MAASGFNALAQAGADNAQRQAQYKEQQRVAGRDAQAAQFTNAIQNPANDPFDPKLQPTVDDTADVSAQKQAEIAKRQAYREQLFQQHNALFAPHEAPTLFQRLGALASGKVKPRSDVANTSSAPVAPAATAPGQPASATPPQVDQNGNPVAPAPVVKDMLGIPISDPAVAAAHQEPMHPLAPNHPILDRFKEGLDALGSHLQAAAHPIQAPDPNANARLLAQTYAAPETIKRQDVAQAAQNAQALQNLKGGNQITVAEIRQGGVRGQAGQPLSLDSATALNENEGQQFIDRNTGKPIDFDAVKANVPGAKLTPYYQGQRLLGYEVADQKGHVITADNLKKAVGEFGQPLVAVPPLGAATVPKTVARSSTDPFGLTTTSSSTTTPQTPVSSAAPVLPADGSAPTANATALNAVNAAIQANKGKAGAPNRKAVANSAPQAPLSSNAPVVPGQLDNTGHIPLTAGNKMVVEMANQLIDGNDLNGMPAKAKEAAAALARQFKPDLNVAQNKINLNYAGNLGTQSTIKLLDSLVGRDGKGGNLDEAVRLSDSVPRTQFPPINSPEMKALVASGNTPAAVFASSITEVADMVAKILQGGGTGSATSDAKLNQAQSMFNTSFNSDQFKGVAKELKTLLANRKAGMVAGNQLLEKQTAPTRPANVPSGYVYKVGGPKGTGWYRP